MSNRAVNIGLAAIGLYGVTSYAAFHTYKIYKLPSPPQDSHLPRNQTDFRTIYNNEPDQYDSKIEFDEWFMGLAALRRNLCLQAQGDTLETSSGTGRNFDFFEPMKLSGLLFTDSSMVMLKTGLVKFRAFKEKYKNINVDFQVMDGHTLKYEDKSFDTVLQTFGLCSHEDPVVTLKEASRVVKDHGKILLLEHGRSYYNWLNVALDKTASDHAQRWGCWWNRDILSLLDEAGLEVLEMKRTHFGTTYSITARKKNL